MSRDTRDTPATPPASVQARPVTGSSGVASRLTLASLATALTLFSALAGAVGSYAVTGWRVTALETKAAALETKLEATTSTQVSTAQRVAIVETRLEGLAHGIDRLEAGLARVEAKLDTLKAR